MVRNIYTKEFSIQEHVAETIQTHIKVAKLIRKWEFEALRGGDEKGLKMIEQQKFKFNALLKQTLEHAGIDPSEIIKKMEALIYAQPKS